MIQIILTKQNDYILNIYLLTIYYSKFHNLQTQKTNMIYKIRLLYRPYYKRTAVVHDVLKNNFKCIKQLMLTGSFWQDCYNLKFASIIHKRKFY